MLTKCHFLLGGNFILLSTKFLLFSGRICQNLQSHINYIIYQKLYLPKIINITSLQQFHNHPSVLQNCFFQKKNGTQKVHLEKSTSPSPTPGSPLGLPSHWAVAMAPYEVVNLSPPTSEDTGAPWMMGASRWLRSIGGCLSCFSNWFIVGFGWWFGIFPIP